MDLQEWVRKYELKTGEKFVSDKRYGLFFLPDKGFCEIGQTKDMLVVNQLCGDVLFWKRHLEDVARKLGYKMCGTWCIRKGVKAYIRLMGYRIVKETRLSDGRMKYDCKNKSGRKGWVSPAFTNKDNKNEGYFVTWEVT